MFSHSFFVMLKKPNTPRLLKAVALYNPKKGIKK